MTFWALLLFILIGFAICSYDFREQRVPNLLALLLLATGVAFVFLKGEDPWVSLWCMLGLGGGAFLTRTLFFLLRKKEGLGMGDIKLLSALGWWIHPSDIPVFLIATGFSGVILGSVWLYVTKEKEFPFSPAIFSGYLILIFFKLETFFGSGILGGLLFK